MKKNLQFQKKQCKIDGNCSGLWLKIQARCGQKDPRKPSRRDRAVIMAYLRSKSSENRVKAGVGAKTRSAGQQNHIVSALKVRFQRKLCFFLFLFPPEEAVYVFFVILVK